VTATPHHFNKKKKKTHVDGGMQARSFSGISVPTVGRAAAETTWAQAPIRQAGEYHLVAEDRIAGTDRPLKVIWFQR
jgi:hypothetical protein